ncbi:hypothetical protein Mal15_62640 [Stieleria maiorica]|uniref:Uncharacterized protein n=1 Tax=Stieleria maiorica TaxID=2795974 RepID=A0A5B9MLG9_9BACT|nr:hypothetical protein Mal15_62640 [Stieleria maiorica]
MPAGSVSERHMGKRNRLKRFTQFGRKYIAIVLRIHSPMTTAPAISIVHSQSVIFRGGGPVVESLISVGGV